MAIPQGLHFVPVDFEKGQSWWEPLAERGFSVQRPSIVVSTGVSMYLTREANRSTLQQLAKLADGSTFAMTFMLTLDLLDSKERSTMEFVMKKAGESGTPFLSLFTPEQMIQMARDTGFRDARYVSGEDLFLRYFADRPDKLRAGIAEAFLVAST